MVDINAYRKEAIPCRKVLDRMIEDRKKNDAVKGSRSQYSKQRIVTGTEFLRSITKEDKPNPRITRYALTS